jgi:hypothetical protein
MATQDLFTSRNNGADGPTQVGQQGRVWYDSVTNVFRESDGVTPGGRIIGGASISSLNQIGSFHSTETQTNLITQGNEFTYNVTDISNGITIQNNSHITFANAGRFNLQFSAQLDKTDSGQDTVEIWLRKNSVNVPWTNTIIDVNNNNGKAVAAWNFIIEPSAGDYYELMWFSTDTSMRILAQPVNSRPAVPSIILTVTHC